MQASHTYSSHRALTFHPEEVLLELMKGLKPREQDIVKRRFGLFGQDTQTLEQIGKSYHITRERVRQIESMILKEIRHSDNYQQLLDPIEKEIIDILDHHGSLMAEDFLLDILSQSMAAKDEKEHVRHFYFLLLSLEPKLQRFKESVDHKHSWGTKLASLEFVNDVIEEVTKMIEENEQPLHYDEIWQRIADRKFFQAHMNKLKKQHVYSYLHISKHVGRNVFDHWGPKTWETVQPKSLADKITLIFKESKEKQPMHFTEIAEKINTLGFSPKQISPQTVHNELIKLKHFILVGRGMYAPADWGYYPGTVKQVMTRILEENGGLMNKADLVDAVLAQRHVKKTTVILALTDKEKFRKTGDQIKLVTAA